MSVAGITRRTRAGGRCAEGWWRMSHGDSSLATSEEGQFLAVIALAFCFCSVAREWEVGDRRWEANGRTKQNVVKKVSIF
jgi:hypothetical protein